MSRGEDIIREGKRALFNFSIGILDIFGFERWSSIDQGINNDPKAPNVDLITMPSRL